MQNNGSSEYCKYGQGRDIVGCRQENFRVIHCAALFNGAGGCSVKGRSFQHVFRCENINVRRC